ncbi:MAG: hypothetical protein ACH37Z_08195 [Anaerolineae bacterium]|nr:hypothetical protein [Ardenticatenia bacterium]
MKRTIQAFAILLVIGAIVALLVIMPSQNRSPLSGQSDLDVITETIRLAFVTRGEACLAENFGEKEEYLTQLNLYWSPATPSPDEVATSEVDWPKEHATYEPSYFATLEAQALNDYNAGLIDEKTYLHSIDPAVPTPSWYPNDTAQDFAAGFIDDCHQGDGHTGFGFVSIDDPDFEIENDTAIGTVKLTYWYEFDRDGTTVHVDRVDEVYQYGLEKPTGGTWKLVDELLQDERSF